MFCVVCSWSSVYNPYNALSDPELLSLENTNQICKASSKQRVRRWKKNLWGQSSPLPQMPLVFGCLLLEPGHVSTPTRLEGRYPTGPTEFCKCEIVPSLGFMSLIWSSLVAIFVAFVPQFHRTKRHYSHSFKLSCDFCQTCLLSAAQNKFLMKNNFYWSSKAPGCLGHYFEDKGQKDR